METIDKKKFEEAEKLAPPKRLEAQEIKELSEEEFQNMLESMQNPVQAQKCLAVQIKNFLDQRIKQELETKGILSDHTRRWVEQFNKILDSLQKAIYGDRKVSINFHKVSHSLIAKKIREFEEEDEKSASS